MACTYNNYQRFGNGGFHILHLNIHSLRHKMDRLAAELQHRGEVQVVCIAETWIQPGKETSYQLAGYSGYHVTQDNGYCGLSVYVRNSTRHVLGHRKLVDGVHVITIELDSCNVIAIYRRPYKSNMGFLSSARSSDISR